MYAAVEQYEKARQEAEERYHALCREKEDATYAEDRQAETYAARQEIWERLYAAVGEARLAREAAEEQAAADLRKSLEQEGDALAVWVFDNAFKDYPNHVLEVLKVLPASLEELTELAREYGWCNVFDNYLRQARRAGVIAPMTAREELETWFAEQLYDRRSETFYTLTEHLDKVVAEAKAHALDEYHNQHKAASE